MLSHLSKARRHFAKKAVKITPEVKKWIKRLIWKELSPEQVADYLKQHKGIFLHHETIYRLIYQLVKLNFGVYIMIKKDILSPSSVIVSLNILGVVEDFHLLLVDGDKDKEKIVLLYLSLLRVLHEKLDVYPMDFKMHRDGKGVNPREHSKLCNRGERVQPTKRQLER